MPVLRQDAANSRPNLSSRNILVNVGRASMSARDGKGRTAQEQVCGDRGRRLVGYADSAEVTFQRGRSTKWEPIPDPKVATLRHQALLADALLPKGPVHAG